MKTTSVAVLALISASALAQPIVVLQGKTSLETRDFAPSDITDLEARKIHINWGKVGNFFKKAAKTVAGVLLKRDEDGNVYLVARDDDGELLARDFEDDYLEARDIDDYLEARGFDDEYLEARDFDDEYLEARDFDDEYLEARDFDDYLEARDLEERSRFSQLGHAAQAFHHGHPSGGHRGHQGGGHHIHFHLGQQQQDNDNQRRDLEERSIFGGIARVGEGIFKHAHKAHKVSNYVPQNNNNNNNNRRQRRDLGSLSDLD
ncbi:hypothetical protein JOM56_008134 [Amanita muscaria]